jgi:hypothetical protein
MKRKYSVEGNTGHLYMQRATHCGVMFKACPNTGFCSSPANYKQSILSSAADEDLNSYICKLEDLD